VAATEVMALPRKMVTLAWTTATAMVVAALIVPTIVMAIVVTLIATVIIVTALLMPLAVRAITRTVCVREGGEKAACCENANNQCQCCFFHGCILDLLTAY